MTSLASQAAVAFENTRLIQEIKGLFNSFVDASVTAIESRDPTTSGHSERRGHPHGGHGGDGWTRSTSGPFRDVRFTRDQLQEIRYASLLHDFGKVGVREKVLIKGKKLYVGEMLLIRQRFAYIKRTLEAEHLRAKLEQVLRGPATPELLAPDGPRLRGRAGRDRRAPAHGRAGQRADHPGGGELPRAHGPDRAAPSPTWRAAASPSSPPTRWARSPSARAACPRRSGARSRATSPTPSASSPRSPGRASTGACRRSPTPTTRSSTAPAIRASSTGDDIPIQSRMMTISDIFDALVAWDRPYKKSVPVEQALDILREEAGAGKLDRQLLDLFVDAKVYERTLPRAGAEPMEVAR